MDSENYRKALEKMHGLVDSLEDVTNENKMLANENKELEKDVKFIAEKHNNTVEELNKLAQEARKYRVGKICKEEETQVNSNVVNNANDQNVVFNAPQIPNKITDKISRIKSRAIFIVSLVLVLLLAIGASPSNVVSWEKFTDLYIEYICNPATMAMSVTLVVLLYKGIIKRNKK
jgi:uncharacterized membrane protein